MSCVDSLHLHNHLRIVEGAKRLLIANYYYLIENYYQLMLCAFSSLIIMVIDLFHCCSCGYDLQLGVWHLHYSDDSHITPNDVENVINIC